jgi:hypothetical protein
MLIHPPARAKVTQVGLIAADAGVARGSSGDRVELLAATSGECLDGLSGEPSGEPWLPRSAPHRPRRFTPVFPGGRALVRVSGSAGEPSWAGGHLPRRAGGNGCSGALARLTAFLAPYRDR